MLRARLLVLVALAAPPLLLAAPRPAQGSVAVALTLKDLVERSDGVVVGVPKSRFSRWEGGRIVTYHSVAIDSVVSGSGKAGASVVVRTLGGIVDGIGQIAHGEAVLKPDAPVMLFLRAAPASMTDAVSGSQLVVGMSQGALPVVVGTDKVPRIGASAADLVLVPKADPSAPSAPKPVAASVATNGRPVSDVVSDIRKLWADRAKK